MSQSANINDSMGAPDAGLLRRVQWRVNAGVFLSAVVVPVAGVIVAFGVAFLFTRMLAPGYSPYAFVVLAGVPVALVWGWIRCMRTGRFFNQKELVELTDHLSAGDGLASTTYERPGLTGGAAAWLAVAAGLDTHPLRLDARWFAWRLLPAALFAAAVFMVPPRKPSPPPNANVMMAITQPLSERLKMTSELLPEAEREQLEQQLEQVQSTPEGISKEKWEAVEDLEQRLENALAQSEASAYQLSASMNQLAGMVSQQEAKAPNANNPNLQADIEAMAASITDQLKKKNLPMNKALRDSLMKAMGKCRGGKCDANALSRLLKECDALSKKLSECKDGKCTGYGRGGVSRGRGDAPLIFGDEHTLEQTSFDAKQLENQFFSADDLTDVGITPMEPKPNPGMFKPGTVKDFGVQQGTNINRTQISPSQRGVVSRYFE